MHAKPFLLSSTFRVLLKKGVGKSRAIKPYVVVYNAFAANLTSLLSRLHAAHRPAVDTS